MSSKNVDQWDTMIKVPMVNLSGTGLKISKLGFGTAYLGEPSLCTSPEEGGRILAESYEMGINFWDTADDYGSHPHVASALKHVPRREVVISTKTSARCGRDAEKSLRDSLRELDTDYLDIFLLHAVESSWVKDCPQVLKELNDLKTTGVVKAIGLSTHSVAVVREASQFNELDVLMTICCKADQAIVNELCEHIPLDDGSIEEMFNAVKLAHDSGKGVIAMKVLGSSAPPLVRNYESSIKSIAQLDFVDAMVIGMKSLDEVRKNAKAILSS